MTFIHSSKVDPETLFNADESPPRAEPAPPEKDVSYQNDKLAIAGCWLYGKCPAITFMCLPILPFLPAMNLELIGWWMLVALNHMFKLQLVSKC